MLHISNKHESTRTEKELLTVTREGYFMTANRNEPARATQDGTSASKMLPVWDRATRELRIGDKVVKQFKWPAENQEKVLDAFQDQGWPIRIADPLAEHPMICPKRRLHDTLKCLNRKQIDELIKFRGDGTGRGVLLEIKMESDPEKQPIRFCP